MGYKNVMCQNFIKHRKCSSGINCTSAHGVHDLQLLTIPPLNAYKVKSVHGVHDLQLLTIPPLNAYKVKMCPATEEGRFCAKGSACWDLHSAEEATDGICHLFRDTGGRCYFPDCCPKERHSYAKAAAPFRPNQAHYWRLQDLLRAEQQQQH